MFSGGQVKICDFGASYDKKEDATTTVGDRYNRSPEIKDGEKYSNIVDVYSLGDLTHYLLYRKHAIK